MFGASRWPEITVGGPSLPFAGRCVNSTGVRGEADIAPTPSMCSDCPKPVATRCRYSAADIKSNGRRVRAPESKSRASFIEQPIDFIAARDRRELGHLIIEEQNFVVLLAVLEASDPTIVLD